jgi:pimeloyl-ACP methyl ester carboxylesterase
MRKITIALVIILSAFIIGVLGIIFLRPNLIISKAEARKELALPSSHFINWRGAELHYTDEGTGIPVLMIHGFGGSLRNFSPLAEVLKNRYRVIRVDLPGFGLSDFPDMGNKPNYLQMYKDYLGFIIDTLHLDSVYVIGNSMGGGMAWLMAAEHPQNVRKLVLLASAGYDVANVAGKLTMFKYKTLGDLMFARGMPMFMSEKGLKFCYADKSKVDPANWKLNNHFTNREGNIQNMLALARSQQFPDSNEIKQVKCPTLIIWGQEDSIIPVTHAAKFHRDIKDSRVIIYDPCGHTPMQERTADVAIDFVKFVEVGDSLKLMQ